MRKLLPALTALTSTGSLDPGGLLYATERIWSPQLAARSTFQTYGSSVDNVTGDSWSSLAFPLLTQ